jgi:tetratricopeptide (TPR) repeat protein
MDALISGQAGVAILSKGNITSVIKMDDPETLLPYPQAAIPYLLDGATDVVELKSISKDGAIARLKKDWQNDRALQLMLILLDDTEDTETHELAVECLQDLLSDPATYEFVANRLYSAPLPLRADLTNACFLAGSASVVIQLLQKIETDQIKIRLFRESWDSLPIELFGDKYSVKQKFQQVIITSGVSRKLIKAGTDPNSFNSARVQCQLELKSLPNSRPVFEAWLKPFQPEKTIHELSAVAECANIQDYHKVKIVRPYDAFENVKKQKEAILSSLKKGDLVRMRNYLEQLIVHQLKNNGEQYAVKSLCDIAKQAKEVFNYPLQLELAKWAVDILPHDVWSRRQVADALKDLGRLPDALASYEDVIRDFPSNVVARNGRAEVLKDLGRLPDALASYEDVIRDFPSNVVARNGRAEVLKDLGRLPEALASYEAVIQEFPSDVVAQSGKAEVLKHMGRFIDAIGIYNEIIHVCPYQQRYQYAKAAILAITGNYPEAEALLPINRPQTHSEWVAYHIRGMIFLRTGKIEEACAIFQDGLQSAPFAIDRKYFKTALAVANIQLQAFDTAAELLDEGQESVIDILRIHVFGALGLISDAAKAYQRLKTKCLDSLVSLRDELAARYQIRPAAPCYDLQWVFEQECRSVLLNAA